MFVKFEEFFFIKVTTRPLDVQSIRFDLILVSFLLIQTLF